MKMQDPPPLTKVYPQTCHSSKKMKMIKAAEMTVMTKKMTALKAESDGCTLITGTKPVELLMIMI